jgi:cephalosporin hydroxylase
MTHDPYDPEAAAKMAADRETQKLARQFFQKTYEHRYSYNFSWLGRPIIQYPQDVIALQEIIWRTRPGLIVETGVAHGGLTVFFASMLELLGGDGEVAGVDIEIRPHNRAAIEAHPLARRIRLIEGSSVDPKVTAQVAERAARKRPVMVVLDSNHSQAHVLAELQAYSPLVARGGYLVVMDTIVEWVDQRAFAERPWGRGDSPMSAVRQFLAVDDRFELDARIEEKLLITAAAGGYLLCVKD